MDPWEIAIESIARCKRLGQSYAAGRSELHEVAEALRRLAWGPDDGDTWPVPVRSRRRKQIPGQLRLWVEALEMVA
jgi:hypothetical protein